MTRSPFTTELDETRYFPAACHEEATARLSFAIEQRHPVAVLSGATGVGKTFLLKMLASRVRASGRVGVWMETPVDDDDVRSRLAEQLGLPTWQFGTQQPTWQQIREKLRGLQLTERQTVLLMELAPEDASMPSISRLLAWARGEFRGALTVILAGSPRLAAIYETADRFAMLRIELQEWTADEVARFIQSRLQPTAIESPRFTESAMRMVADLSKGVPRDVLAIGDIAWAAARVDGLTKIDESTVLAAVREWVAKPASPFAERLKPAATTTSSSARQSAAMEFAAH